MGFRFTVLNMLGICLASKCFLFRNPKRKPQPRFRLSDISEYDARKWFRFEKNDLTELQRAVRIPKIIITRFGDHATGMESLYILLRRLAYPNRLFESAKLMKRSISAFSHIFNHTLDLVYVEHKHLLEGIMNSWVTRGDLECFADAISRKGCVGFIDGTMRATCRPGKNQKVAYSGHKRHHGIKFQAVMFPNGIIEHLYGPIEGCRDAERKQPARGTPETLPAPRRWLLLPLWRSCVSYVPGFA